MAIDSGSVNGQEIISIKVRPVRKGRPQRRLLVTEDTGDGSGTTNIELSPDNGTTWANIAEVTLGENIEFKAWPRAIYRLRLSGGTNPDFNYWVL